MSKASQSRSRCGSLLVVMLAAAGLLSLASPARAGLVLQLSGSGTGMTSGLTITTAGTYTFYLFADVTSASGGPSGDGIKATYVNLVATQNSLLTGTNTSSGITNFALDPSFQYTTGHAGSSSITTGAAAGALGWGSPTSTTAQIIAAPWCLGAPAPIMGMAGNGTTVGGTTLTNGFAGADGNSWDFLLGTITLTINQADLAAGALTNGGTVTYVAKTPTNSVPATKSTYYTTAQGGAAGTSNQITYNGTNTGFINNAPLTSSNFVITYQPAVSNPTLSLLGGYTSSGTIFAGGGTLAAGATLTTDVAATTVQLQLAGGTGSLTITGGTATAASLSASGTLGLSATISNATAGSYTLNYNGTANNSLNGNPLGTLNLTVLGHANGGLSGTTIALPTVIGGYSGTLAGSTTLTVSNSGGVNLNTTGATGNGFTLTAPGVVSAGGSVSGSYTFSGTETAGPVGGALNLTYGDDPADSTISGYNATLGTATVTISGQVLAHASPSLSTGTTTDIGRVLGGAQVSVQTTLANASNPLGAKLQITSLNGSNLTQTGGPAVNALVTQGTGTTVTAAVLTGTATYGPGSFTIGTADDQAYAGKGATPLASQTLTVTGTIGWAQATSTSTPGPALSAAVSGSMGSPSNPLFSQVDVTTSLGAQGTRAEVLGSQTTAGTLTMAWRQATATELGSAKTPLVSDVLHLGGDAMTAGLVYVLDMSINTNAWPVAGNLAALEAAGKIYLASDSSGNWQNATLDDTAVNGADAVANFQGTYQQYLGTLHDNPTLATELGAWGVGHDEATNQDVVWAVLDHASEFAVVPEPATMAFLLLGGLAMAGTAIARRSNARKQRKT